MEAGHVYSPTVRRIVGPTILLQSGNYFDFMAPEQCTFTIEDIAHGLSNVCRFAGQCSRFYSVAQHSVLVSRIVPPEDAYAALMHDGAEALIGDVSKPLKDLLPDYRRVEAKVEAAVFERFRVPPAMPASVKQADLIMLATEQHLLMPDREGRSYAGGHTPLDISIPAMNPAEAKAAFLARFAELAPEGVMVPAAASPLPGEDLAGQGECAKWADDLSDELARMGREASEHEASAAAENRQTDADFCAGEAHAYQEAARVVMEFGERQPPAPHPAGDLAVRSGSTNAPHPVGTNR